MQTVTFQSSPDRPEQGTQAAYFAGLGFFFAGAAGLCGAGGLASIRRSTSSGFGSPGGCALFTARLAAGMMGQLSAPIDGAGKGLMAGISVPEDEALALCAIAKTASPAKWAQGDQQGSLWCEFGVVCAPPRPGLLVSIRINRGYKIKRRTMSFGLWDTSSGAWERVYQLTVGDSSSPTHSEQGIAWFGSHDHMGPKAMQRNEFDEADFGVSLQSFCTTIALHIEEPIVDPLDPNSFKLDGS